MRELWLFLFIAAAITADQITKQLAVNNFSFGEIKPFVPGLLNFTLTSNDGVSFGMLPGLYVIVIPITCIVVAAALALLAVRFFKSVWLAAAVALVAAGGIGNLIDRITSGEVVDFLQFDFMQWFPIFNLADCFVVVGSAIMILFFIWDIIKESRENKKSAPATNHNPLEDDENDLNV